jgi:hypothetical protein
MKFKELLASGSLNRENYDHYVGFGSRSTETTVTDCYGGTQTTVTHYHGSRVAGQIVTHRPTGKTQYFIRQK